MEGRWRRWVERRPLAADGVLALGALLVDLLLAGAQPSGPLTYVLAFAVAGAVPIALRRVAPWPAVGCALASLAALFVVDRTTFTVGLAFVVLTYTFAAWHGLRTALLVALVLWVPVLVVTTAARYVDPVTQEGSPVMLAFNNVLVALVAFFVGRSVHNRRASTRALEERARVAEANQESLAEQAVADERRRIARELHDVVAHHVSVMGVLATGARRVLRRDPDAADEALTTIEGTSRTTLREMRRLLDVLRTEADPSADLTPQPGLAGIEALVEQVHEAGLPVRLEVVGTPAPPRPPYGWTSACPGSWSR
jgi:signal transduction histidine kinase